VASVRVGGQIVVSLVMCILVPVMGLGPGSNLRARSFFVFCSKPTRRTRRVDLG